MPTFCQWSSYRIAAAVKRKAFCDPKVHKVYSSCTLQISQKYRAFEVHVWSVLRFQFPRRMQTLTWDRAEDLTRPARWSSTSSVPWVIPNVSFGRHPGRSAGFLPNTSSPGSCPCGGEATLFPAWSTSSPCSLGSPMQCPRGTKQPARTPVSRLHMCCKL